MSNIELDRERAVRLNFSGIPISHIGRMMKMLDAYADGLEHRPGWSSFFRALADAVEVEFLNQTDDLAPEGPVVVRLPMLADMSDIELGVVLTACAKWASEFSHLEVARFWTCVAIALEAERWRRSPQFDGDYFPSA